MADVEVDYQAVQTVTGLLNNAVQTIVPQLQSLQSQVDGLLAQDGGLWLTSTSPVLQSSYQTFNASLTNAVNGISNFAQQFTSIAGQIKSMDTQMATSLSSSS